MNKEKILSVLYGKEKVEVYREFQEIESSIDASDELYRFFDEIEEMLLDEKSFIRVRAFRVICRLAKWDNENKINEIIELLLSRLDDDKPTVVRQMIAALDTLLLYKPELFDSVKSKLNKIDLSKYKDSMSPLIKKDIDNILTKNGDLENINDGGKYGE